jgi:hypothetical protein
MFECKSNGFLHIAALQQLHQCWHTAGCHKGCSVFLTVNGEEAQRTRCSLLHLAAAVG